MAIIGLQANLKTNQQRTDRLENHQLFKVLLKMLVQFIAQIYLLISIYRGKKMGYALIPTSSTTLILNGFTFGDFIAGDNIEINPVNSLTDRLNGAKDSFTVTERVDGNVHDMVFRVLRYSDNDVALNRMINQKPIAIINGSLKQDYVRNGVDGLENWTLEGGTFTTQPSFKKNDQTGNHVTEYTIQFRNAARLI